MKDKKKPAYKPKVSKFGHQLSKSKSERKFNFGTGGRSNKPVSLAGPKFTMPEEAIRDAIEDDLEDR